MTLNGGFAYFPLPAMKGFGSEPPQRRFSPKLNTWQSITRRQASPYPIPWRHSFSQNRSHCERSEVNSKGDNMDWYEIIGLVVGIVAALWGGSKLWRHIPREVGEALITLADAIEDDRLTLDEVRAIVKSYYRIINAVTKALGGQT